MTTKLLDTLLDEGCSGNFKSAIRHVIHDRSDAKRLAQEFVWKRWDMSNPGDVSRFRCICRMTKMAAVMTGQAELVPLIPAVCKAYELANMVGKVVTQILRLIGRLVLFFVILGMTDFVIACWSCIIGWCIMQLLGRVLHVPLYWELSMFATALAGYLLSEFKANPETLALATVITTVILSVLIFVWNLLNEKIKRIGTCMPMPLSRLLRKLLPPPDDMSHSRKH